MALAVTPALGACGGPPASSTGMGAVGAFTSGAYNGNPGDTVYDATNHTLATCNGTSWVDLASGGGSLSGSGSTGYDAIWTSPTAIGTGLLFESGGNVGIGTTAPVTNLSVYNGNQSTTLTNFTQALTNAGINIMTGYTANAYTPGVFWSTANNNPAQPKAGIWLEETSSGTYMNFGTSNNYATGVTNQAMVIDYNGYGVMGPTQETATKLNGYGVTGPTRETATKFVAYAVVFQYIPSVSIMQ